MKRQEEKRKKEKVMIRLYAYTSEKKKVKKTTKQMAPETLAIIFFLKNRKPEDWRDKREVEVKGEISMTNALKAARERVIKNE